ncbi:MAG: hypothetical protein ACRD8W_01525 [Nitrososphaeraceae archaeon]
MPNLPSEVWVMMICFGLIIVLSMRIAPQLRNILGIVADLSHYNTDASVIDRAVIERTGLSPSQVTDMISQLESLGLVNRQIKVSGADFRLLNITPKGLNELMNS